jgi:hypothetical protein
MIRLSPLEEFDGADLQLVAVLLRACDEMR